MLDNPGKVVTKFQFSDLFRQAWYKAINPEVITAGFRIVGVCPFNHTAIKCMGSETLDSEQGVWKHWSSIANIMPFVHVG